LYQFNHSIILTHTILDRLIRVINPRVLQSEVTLFFHLRPHTLRTVGVLAVYGIRLNRSARGVFRCFLGSAVGDIVSCSLANFSEEVSYPGGGEDKGKVGRVLCKCPLVRGLARRGEGVDVLGVVPKVAAGGRIRVLSGASWGQRGVSVGDQDGWPG